MASPATLAKMKNEEGEYGALRKMDRSHLVSKRTLDWTSRRSPGSSVGDALTSNVKTSQELHVGIHALKVTSFGKMKRRVLTVSNDFYALFVTHGKVASGDKGLFSRVAKTLKTPLLTRKGWSKRDMYVRYIDVADIDYIQTGVVGTHKLEAVGGKGAAKGRLKGKNGLIDSQAQHTVSIIHHGNKSLDVLVLNDTQQEALVKCLQDMIQVYREAMLNVGNEELLLRYIWYDIDTTNDGLIQQQEFLKMTARINLYVSNPAKLYKKYLKELQESKTNSQADGLSYHESMCLLQRIKSGYYTGGAETTMKKLQSGVAQTVNKKKKITVELPAMALWDELFGADVSHVSCDDFLNKFLLQRQGETEATLDDVQALVQIVNSMELNREKEEIKANCMSKTRFEAYLLSSMNDAYDAKAQKLDKGTLKEPISHYWINTSHNTYLMGDQLQSTSSVGMYMEALRRGCKCLELDCWDGEKSMWGVPIPIVYHGHTLTTRIAFGDIIKGVKSYVDANPKTYPIILSLENHCSHPFQETMARMLKDTLGDLLYIPYANAKAAREAENEVLRSPESLRGKVLIKGKRPPDDDEGDDLTAAVEDEEDPYEDAGGAPSPKGGSPKRKDGKTESKPPKIVKELAQMTLFHGTHYKSFDKSIELPTAHMHSIGETKINKILQKDKDNANLWRKYNVRHMTRTYPGGARVDSSNYNPVVAWSMGCQLVALNFQTNDAPLLLNDGRFRQNGGCGYVLKPKSVMGYTIGPQSPTTVRVKILSGSCLPKPSGAKEGETIDPYVQVAVHDIVVDEKTGCEGYATENFCTDCVDDNGFCPIWSGTETENSAPIEKEFTIHNVDAAMIIFSLWEQDLDLDDKVGDAAIPLSCLRKGVRSIQLYDPNGTRTGPFGFATLLVEIDY